MSGSSGTSVGNITLGVDANRDIYLGADGNLVVLTGLPALIQDCESAMRTRLSECVLQPKRGLPMFEDIWINRNYIQYEAAARKALLAIPNVIKITSFTYQQSGENFYYVAVIKTAYSPQDFKIIGTLDDAINNTQATSPVLYVTNPNAPPGNQLGIFTLDQSVLG